MDSLLASIRSTPQQATLKWVLTLCKVVTREVAVMAVVEDVDVVSPMFDLVF